MTTKHIMLTITVAAITEAVRAGKVKKLIKSV